MALTAADLQKRHELEGAPDPFPSLSEPIPGKSRFTGASHEELDTNSQVAFPSLSASVVTTQPSNHSTWATAAGPRIRAAVSKNPVFTDSFTLSAIDLSTAGKDGKSATLGEVMKQVMTKYKVKIEASANQRTRQTTFYLRTESQKDLDKAKRSLLALLSPIITLVLNAPVSTIGAIIGPKGATLKQIRDQTGVRIDIPRRDSSTPVNSNSVPSSGKATPLVDIEDEPIVPITLTGPQPLALEAQDLLKQIIASKTSKATQRVRDIPEHIFPFVASLHASFRESAKDADVNITNNFAACMITVTGDRDAVILVIGVIKSTIEALSSGLTSVKMSLPKRQHHLLSGDAAIEIMATTKCWVVLKPEEPTEEIVVWGQVTDLPAGLGAVMQMANSQYIHEFPLPGPAQVARQLLTYLTRIGYSTTLANAQPGVTVYMPSLALAESASTINIDIVGDKPVVDAVVRRLSVMIGKLIGATREVNIDWLVHRVIAGKYAKKLKHLNEVHNVQVFFPPDSAEKPSVLLVYDPFSPSASPSPLEKEKHLEEVAKELLKFAKDVADVKSQVLNIDKKLHDAVIGKGGTTLNAIIGEDKTLSVKLGTAAGQSTEDAILVRGASADVDRAVKEILQIVENAKNDEIVNSYSVEFDIERDYVGRIVGSHGSGINKLREQLGVSVDISDDVDEKEKESGGKKKKATHLKSKVKITGRKENVEEAKRRMLSQIEKLADETSEILQIPAQYHSSLIGQNGKYAIRLEDKYSVKITFPRQTSENGEGRTREQLKADEVLVKGGKKGVAGAKSELLEALEFEKENNNILKFLVPTRSVSRILGRGGATINEIKTNTDAQIDVEKMVDGDGVNTQVIVRGTKAAVAAAKAAVLTISNQIGEEVTVSLMIDSKLHRSLIGPGGQGLRDLVVRCGGPSDSKLHAGLIRFPRPGEQSDEIRLRGDPKLVEKLKVELEKAAALIQDRVVLAVEIPAVQHRALIGRGGQHLTEFQNRTGVQVQFPGSRSYQSVGPPDNATEFTDVNPANIVKVTGPKKACEGAVEELKSKVKPPVPEGPSEILPVPLKYYHSISQQGIFFRNLRTLGVQVDQSALPTKPALPSPNHSGTPSARIDDAEDVYGSHWELALNYQDADEGNSEWTLKARDQAGLDKAKQLVKEAIERAEAMSHVGFLTLPDSSLFPRIVGSKGANVARLRAESGAEITVGRENSTITIIGPEQAVLSAKDAILKIVVSHDRPYRR